MTTKTLTSPVKIRTITPATYVKGAASTKTTQRTLKINITQ